MSTPPKSPQSRAKSAPVATAPVKASSPRRSTIANNPLDSYDPLGHIPSAAEIEEREASRAPKLVAAAEVPAPAELAGVDVPLRQLSARVPADLVQRLKIAVATVGVSQQDALVEAVEMWIKAKGGGTG